MDLSFFYQLSSKKSWWIDALFYLAIAVLLATLLCYGAFLIQSAMVKQAIVKETAALETVGTQDQKSQEQTVIGYQKKLNDFAGLIQNHQFASNVFDFMQNEAMPYVWFQQFVLSPQSATVQLYGQTDTAEDLSRQVAALEQDPHVTKVSILDSKTGSDKKIDFNLSLVMNQNIFQYSNSSLSAVVSPSTLQTAPSQ